MTLGDGITTCRRRGIEFEDSNPAVECGECDVPTLCLACAEDHACCVPDGLGPGHAVHVRTNDRPLRKV